MGSFDAKCEICDEEKWIRTVCNCGICICEECIDDWWIYNDNMCYYCFNSQKEKKKNKILKKKII